MGLLGEVDDVREAIVSKGLGSRGSSPAFVRSFAGLQVLNLFFGKNFLSSVLYD
jgi:hypothetical protein